MEDYEEHFAKRKRVQEEYNKKLFRFDKRFVHDPEFRQVIQNGWLDTDLSRNVSLKTRIRQCRHSISVWKSTAQTNSRKQTNSLIQKIDEAHTDSISTTEDIHLLQNQLTEAYRQEEEYWYNKSRVRWLNKGDRNTRFDHAFTKNRRAMNTILSVHDSSGNVVKGNKHIARVATSFYSVLFTSSNPPNITYKHIARVFLILVQLVLQGQMDLRLLSFAPTGI